MSAMRCVAARSRRGGWTGQLGCLMAILSLLIWSGVGEGSARAAAQEGSAEVGFRVVICAEGVGIADVGETPAEDVPLCDTDDPAPPASAAGVRVELRSSGGEPVDAGRTARDGAIRFTGLSAGVYAAVFDGGHPVAARCYTRAASAESRPILNIAMVGVAVEDGDKVDCIVALSGLEARRPVLDVGSALLPADLPLFGGGGDDAPGLSASPVARGGTGQILVAAVACPDAVAVAAIEAKPDPDGLLCADGDALATPLPGIAVAVSDADTGAALTDGPEGAFGVRAFNDVPLGTYEVTFPDTQDVVSRCAIEDAAGVEIGRVDVTAEPVTLANDGETVTCRVAVGGFGAGAATPVTMQVDHGVNIGIRAYTCTPGDDDALRERLVAAAAPGAILAGNAIGMDELTTICGPALEDILYSLIPAATNPEPDAYYPQIVAGPTTAGGTYLSGWGGAFPGPFTIQAELPEGYGEPVVVCTVESMLAGVSLSVTETREARDGGIAVTLAEGDRLTCDWFNVDLGTAA